MEEKKLPSPTGDIWKPDTKNPATVPISTKLVKTHIRGQFRERERKLWTFLVQAVWEDLEKESAHRLPLEEVNRVFRELGGRHESKWLQDYIRSIAQITVEYETEDSECSSWGITNLISDAEIVTSKEGHVEKEFIEFSFPPKLVKSLLARKQFARLRPHLMITLSGKYAVTLYELLESVANQKSPIFKASVEELRRYLAVQEGTIVLWGDLHRRVIRPAVKELNNKSEDTGFTVTYDLIKGTRNKVTDIHFHVQKVTSRVAFEEQIQKPKVVPIPPRSTLRGFTTREYEHIKKTVPGRHDLYQLEAQWRQENESREIENPVGHFIDFLRRKTGTQVLQKKNVPKSLFSRFLGSK